MRVARRDASPETETAGASADDVAGGAGAGEFPERRRASLFSSEGASASSAAAASVAETTTPSSTV